MQTKTLIAFLLFISHLAYSQKPNNGYNYHIKRASSEIKVDGKPEEKAWKDAIAAKDFFQVLPMDTSFAAVKTEVKLCYDEKNIYVLFVNHDTINGPSMVESMRRDFMFSKNDNDLLFLDTFNDLTTGFSFGSNARGGQWDGLMSNGSRIDVSWDNKWESEVSYSDEVWYWEAAIPFKTIRYKNDILSWGINFSRNDLKSTEKSSWAPIPRQFPTASLAYTGNLVWDTPPPKPGLNVSLIPYINVGRAKNHEDGLNPEFTKNIGFDAKVGLTSSLNLDLTVNPDFSQVDVDVQVTNLDRFELFFPERRQFFLENGDIFNNFGYNGIRPFFSRRIGLDAPIFYGGKLSGKINQNWRVGAMSIQSGENSENAPGSFYNVFSVQRQVFKRSYINAIFVNRDRVGENPEEIENPVSDFNRTVGLEFNLASEDNQWQGKTFFIKTFSPVQLEDNTILAGNIQRNTRHLRSEIQIESVGKGVQANEVGYVQRQDYLLINPRIEYLFFPKSGPVLSHGPGLMIRQYLSRANQKTFEYLHFLDYGITFKDRSELRIWTARDYVKLQNSFDPTNFSGAEIEANTEHRWRAYGFNFDSKPQSLFTYAFSSRMGGYYAQGNRLRLEAEMGYRFQPYVAILMRANYNRIAFGENSLLPESLKNSEHNIWLVGPRLDVTLSNKLFFTNFLQYNQQDNNVNLNARLQWRYKPASDLFIVYTDNYFANDFRVRNRAIVFKFTHWWNV
ncbi:carbohydrate binding family 9 domain-containing protein [Jiulongibacter sediminis]|uniref:Hydrolase n=1 Tax=Jiulongibacter sediminis TaxID=1605367 RepID=A0A0P7BDQ9_9BACT|nr:carbohydrate binding family 9 domain-containing protein [Jiulongibacter sediminis]KPM48878.1 hydrolase [Jiulongibacter sediminis]TBX25409.1 hydrolase [Jiulongibacter sediminis]